MLSKPPVYYLAPSWDRDMREESTITNSAAKQRSVQCKINELKIGPLTAQKEIIRRQSTSEMEISRQVCTCPRVTVSIRPIHTSWEVHAWHKDWKKMVNSNEDKEIIQCTNWSMASLSAIFLKYFFLNTMTLALYLQESGLIYRAKDMYSSWNEAMCKII